MTNKHYIVLMAVLLFPILILHSYSISGLCVRTDTGQVMIGGWAPSGFPTDYPFSWNPFSGEYTATVPPGWSGTITPVSSTPGTFFPSVRTYDYVICDLYNQNYEFTPVTYSISGRVTSADNGQGVQGVTFTNLTGNAVSDANGYYSGNVVSGWSGTVTPHHSLLGTFSPPNRSYSNVLTNLTFQNYIFDENIVSISGTITNNDTGQPLPGVTLYNLPGNPQTNSEGKYFVIVPQGFTAGVTPHVPIAGVFTPPNRVYTNVMASLTEQDYTWSALTYTVSGRVTAAENGSGIGGVTFTGFEQNPVTDPDGFYSATVPWGFTSTVTPIHPQGGSFTPPQRTYTHLTANSLNQNYQWSATAVTDDALPLVQLAVYPNPSKDIFTISFHTDKAAPVCIEIYDLKGRPVRRITDGFQTDGRHSYSWDGHDSSDNLCPNGIYFCRFSAGTLVQTRKIALLR